MPLLQNDQLTVVPSTSDFLPPTNEIFFLTKKTMPRSFLVKKKVAQPVPVDPQNLADTDLIHGEIV